MTFRDGLVPHLPRLDFVSAICQKLYRIAAIVTLKAASKAACHFYV